MEKVSKKIDGGISSAYFDLDYLPSTDRSNTNLNSKCAALIIDMAIADATREEKHIMTLMATFSEALCMCKTQEEIDNFSIFMGKLAAIGGLAKGFSYSMKDMMNEEGKIEAQKIIDYRNNQIKEKKGQRQNNSNELRNFEQSYANLNNEYQKHQGLYLGVF